MLGVFINYLVIASASEVHLVTLICGEEIGVQILSSPRLTHLENDGAQILVPHSSVVTR